MKTFEELHPDTAAYITTNNLQTSVYQRYDNGELAEQWEKVDGIWKDVSRRAILEEQIRKEKEALEELKSEYDELYDAIQWFYDQQIDKIDKT